MLPKYIKKLIETEELVFASAASQNNDYWGYTFKLYGKNSLLKMVDKAEKVVKWAKKQGAEAEIIGTMYYLGPSHTRDHMVIGITDPAANMIENYAAMVYRAGANKMPG